MISGRSHTKSELAQYKVAFSRAVRGSWVRGAAIEFNCATSLGLVIGSISLCRRFSNVFLRFVGGCCGGVVLVVLIRVLRGSALSCWRNNAPLVWSHAEYGSLSLVNPDLFARGLHAMRTQWRWEQLGNWRRYLDSSGWWLIEWVQLGSFSQIGSRP